MAQVLAAAGNLVEAMAREESEAGQQSEFVAVSVPQNVPMPRCILSNTEPYLHGDWRREPYLPRCAVFPDLHSMNPSTAAGVSCTVLDTPAHIFLTYSENWATSCKIPGHSGHAHHRFARDGGMPASSCVFASGQVWHTADLGPVC